MPKFRYKLEYFPVWLLAKGIGMLPRPLARSFCQGIGMFMYVVHRRLRTVGLRNLDLAFPEKKRKEKLQILRRSFVHSLNGNPMNIVVRPLDNPYVDAFVDRYRTLYGNRTFGKQDFARGLLTSMKRGEVVGILMDTNMTPPQGAFVDFFGVPACTATGVARVALHTDAAVLPAFTIWDKELGKYKVRFDPALQLVKTGDDEADAVANTALFTKVIEGYARRYPEQWLWVHRRWKTRPPGEPSVY